MVLLEQCNEFFGVTPFCLVVVLHHEWSFFRFLRGGIRLHAAANRDCQRHRGEDKRDVPGAGPASSRLHVSSVIVAFGISDVTRELPSRTRPRRTAIMRPVIAGTEGPLNGRREKRSRVGL